MKREFCPRVDVRIKPFERCCLVSRFVKIKHADGSKGIQYFVGERVTGAKRPQTKYCGYQYYYSYHYFPNLNRSTFIKLSTIIHALNFDFPNFRSVNTIGISHTRKLFF